MAPPSKPSVARRKPLHDGDRSFRSEASKKQLIKVKSSADYSEQLSNNQSKYTIDGPTPSNLAHSARINEGNAITDDQVLMNDICQKVVNRNQSIDELKRLSHSIEHLVHFNSNRTLKQLSIGSFLQRQDNRRLTSLKSHQATGNALSTMPEPCQETRNSVVASPFLATASDDEAENSLLGITANSIGLTPALAHRDQGWKKRRRLGEGKQGRRGLYGPQVGNG